MAIGPYVRRPYDNSSATASMADLIRRRGDIAAQRELQRGDATAQIAQTVGQAATGMMSDLLRARSDQRVQKERDAQIADRQLERDQRARALSRENNQEGLDQMASAAHLTPEQTADLYDQSGYTREAQSKRDDATKRRDQSIASALQRINLTKTTVGQGAQILQEIQKDPTLYEELRPKLVELAGSIDPGLANEIPQTYEPNTVTGLMQFATQAAVEAESHARGLAKLKDAQQDGLDSLQRTTKQRVGIAQLLSTAKTPEAWNSIITHATDEHWAAPDIIESFGPWSKDAPANAAEIALGPKTEKPGAPIRTRPGDILRDPNDPTKILATNPVAPKDADPGPSRAQRGTYEDRKADELGKAEESLRHDLAPKPVTYDRYGQAAPPPPGWTVRTQGGTPVKGPDGRPQMDPTTGQPVIEGGTSFYVPSEAAKRERFAQHEQTKTQIMGTYHAQMGDEGPAAPATPTPVASTKRVLARADVIARGQQLNPPLSPEEAIRDATARGYDVR